MTDQLRHLLDRALVTHSPTGVEREMDAFIRDCLREYGVHFLQDAAGNIIARLGNGWGDMKPTLISAHKDELCLAVRKIDSEGRIWIEPMGGCRPGKYGEGPFDIVTRHGVVEGVLCVGSTHSSALSARTQSAKDGTANWDLLYVDCVMDGDALREAGVAIGDRAVVGRHRKEPFYLGDDCIGGYALDDKGAVAVLLTLARRLTALPPACPVYLAFTAAEESGCSGGAYATRQLDVDDFIAVEIAPIAEEYDVEFNDVPVVFFKDALYHYSPELCWALGDASEQSGMGYQRQIVRAFGSDASVSMKAGHVARAACVGFPTMNTHGYEVTHLGALENTVRLLETYLQNMG